MPWHHHLRNRALYEDAWLRSRLFDEIFWYPERLGERRRIFEARSSTPWPPCISNQPPPHLTRNGNLKAAIKFKACSNTWDHTRHKRTISDRKNVHRFDDKYALTARTILPILRRSG
jgi:hypothetical protein